MQLIRFFITALVINTKWLFRQSPDNSHNSLTVTPFGSRGSCPFLNSLANEQLIPFDGKQVFKKELYIVLSDFTSSSLQKFLFYFYPVAGSGVFNLDELSTQYNIFSKNELLSLKENGLVKANGGLTFKQFVKWNKYLVNKSFGKNVTCKCYWTQKINTCLLYLLLKNQNTGLIESESLELFLLHNRIDKYNKINTWDFFTHLLSY